MRMGAISHSIHWLSTSATGRMISSLLRSEPIAIFLMIGISRSAAMPWTYWGVTAVSSTTTPAAVAGALPAAAPTSSTEAAARFAIAGRVHRRPIRLGPGIGSDDGELGGVPHPLLGVAERVDEAQQRARHRPPGQEERNRDGDRAGDDQREDAVVVRPAGVADVVQRLDEEAVAEVDDQRHRPHPREPARPAGH